MTELTITPDLNVIAKYWFDSLTRAKGQLGLQDVFYGDQITPRTPALCVEPVSKARILDGIPFQTLNNFTLTFLIYHGKLQDVQLTRLECDQFAERIEKWFHADTQAGGLVTHGFCAQLESGYTVRGGDLLKSSRLTWEGLNKTGITGQVQ